MAKSYVEIFKDSMETQYATGSTPLLATASLNRGVIFNIMPKSNGSATSARFEIQREKRIQAEDSSLNKGTNTGGTDLITALNGAKQVDWETVETFTSAERIICVKVEPKEEIDITGEASAFNRTIAQLGTNTLIEMEEKALAKVAAAPGAMIDLTTTSAQAAADQIQEVIYGIQFLSDAYKHMSDNVVVIIHPKIAEMYAKLQGQGYQLGTNTFPKGFNSSFTYNGTQFFPSKILNSIAGTAAGKVVAAIVMDAEAYANIGVSAGIVPFDETYLGTRYVGHRYHELDCVIDQSRIKVLEFTNTATAKVND